MQNKTKPDLRQSERLKCPHRPHSTPKNCHCKKERTSSSISAYRGSVRFSSEFWPIMDPCGCWQRRWAATPQIPKEVHRDHLKPAWRLWSVRHVYVSLRCLPVILLGARQDLVPRAPNLVPRLPLIRVIQTVKSDFWPREYITVSIVPNFHPCFPPPPPLQPGGIFFCPSRWLWNRSGFRVLFFLPESCCKWTLFLFPSSLPVRLLNAKVNYVSHLEECLFSPFCLEQEEVAKLCLFSQEHQVPKHPAAHPHTLREYPLGWNQSHPGLQRFSCVVLQKGNCKTSM